MTECDFLSLLRHTDLETTGIQPANESERDGRDHSVRLCIIYNTGEVIMDSVPHHSLALTLAKREGDVCQFEKGEY